MTSRCLPQRNKVYTLSQVQNELVLHDTPSLNFYLFHTSGEKIQSWLQTGHVYRLDLLQIPGFAQSKWTFAFETKVTRIPVFYFSDENEEPVTNFIEFEEFIDPYSNQIAFWCTPKGHFHPQYFYRDSEGNIRRRFDRKLFNE